MVQLSVSLNIHSQNTRILLLQRKSITSYQTLDLILKLLVLWTVLLLPRSNSITSLLWELQSHITNGTMLLKILFMTINQHLRMISRLPGKTLMMLRKLLVSLSKMPTYSNLIQFADLDHANMDIQLHPQHKLNTHHQLLLTTLFQTLAKMLILLLLLTALQLLKL